MSGLMGDVCDWVGLIDGQSTDVPRRWARTSFLTALGHPTLVRQLVAIPLAIYTSVAETWTVLVTQEGASETHVEPTPVERGHPGAIRRVARLSSNLAPDEVAPAGTGVCLGGSSRTAGGSCQGSPGVCGSPVGYVPCPSEGYALPMNVEQRLTQIRIISYT